MGAGRYLNFAGLVFSGLLALSAPTQALVLTHAASEVQQFEIPEGPLADALTTFSESTGVIVVFDHAIVEGYVSPAVSGRLTAAQALVKLLEGTSLHYRKINRDTWALIHVEDETLSVTSPTPAVSAAAHVEYKKVRDEIIVSASFRAPTQLAGTRALYTLDNEDLRLQGALNVAEPIFELPATVSSVTSANTALFVSQAGLNLADLRGLGTERTLVLVNGRRFVRTSGGNGTVLGVDLNSIPAPFVERIEVVNQGAGAVIGAEAVGGAINIVTRESIDGIAFTADGGVSEQGDAEEYAFSVLAGKRFLDDRASVTVGATYAVEPSLLVNDRPRYSSPYGFALNGRRSMAADAVFTPGFGGSNITPNGRLSAVQLASGEVVRTGEDVTTYVFSPDGTFSPFVESLDQLYDWTTDFSALPEIERLIGYGSASLELADGHRLYGEAHFARTDVDSQIASAPVSLFGGSNPLYGDGVLAPADNPFIPDGLIADIESQLGEAVSGLILSRRFVELGPRRRNIERESFQLRAGIDGPLRGEWRYDVSYQFGRARADDVATGIANGDRLDIALDVDRCAAVAGCTPIDIFGAGKVTPAQADFIQASPRERIITIREQLAQVKVSGPLFENRGEKAVLSAGIDYRREDLNDEALNYGLDRALGEFIIPGADDSIGYLELFGNVTAPLLVDAPIARRLEVGGAFRYIDRENGDGFLNVSGNARWAPLDGLNFYTHIFHGGRAPSIVELAGNGPDTGRLFFDPCANADASPTVQANCASDGVLGVDAGFQQINSLALYRSTGNPNLSEERVNSQVYGVSVDFHGLFPELPGSLTVSADWRNHKVTDVISSLSHRRVLDDCYSSENLSSFVCGLNAATGSPFIERDPDTRQITSVYSALLNGGEIKTNGLDGRMQFVTDLQPGGLLEAFAVDVLYTYIHRARETSPYTEKESRLEGLVNYPRHQLHITTSLGSDAAKTVWTVRRRGSALSTRMFDIPEARIPAVTYVDASLQFRPTGNSIFFVGIENLLDKEAPIVYGANGNTFYEYYDIIGRRFFAGVKAEF